MPERSPPARQTIRPSNQQIRKVAITIKCKVLRCSKQDEIYIYLRDDLKPESIPSALLNRAGNLLEVMQLELSADRKLARVDVKQVITQLERDGYYLQMPPNGLLSAKLYAGD